MILDNNDDTAMLRREIAEDERQKRLITCEGVACEECGSEDCVKEEIRFYSGVQHTGVAESWPIEIAECRACGYTWEL